MKDHTLRGNLDGADDILRHFPTLLRRWDGSIARMWTLTTSHRTLVLRLEQNGRVGNLQIACIEPEFIHGPTEWWDSHIEIERHANGFVVKDERAGLEVHTGHVELAENRKPLNVFTLDATSGKTG
ncbi:MAG TPA: hypothetical protein VJ810_10990 [Blastocatellia bacterium]|nr:hypothetical protein [Blastocatellia bacterium]